MTDSNPDDDDLTHALAAELRDLIGQLRRRMRDESPIDGISLSQRSVIGRLFRDGPATVTALARAEGMRPQSMGEAMAPLKAAGLVVATPDPDDGRQSVLSLTEACHDLILRTQAQREGWLFRTLQGRFNPAERAELAAATTYLKRLLEP